MKKLLLIGSLTALAPILFYCAAGNPGRRSYQAGDYKRTLKLTKQAVLKDSTDIKSWILMAKAYIELDSLSEADASLQRALPIGLKDPGPRQEISDLYFRLSEGTERNRDIIRYLKTAEELSPQSREVLERLARLYQKAGELEEAYERYDRLVMLVKDPTEYGFITNSLANKIEFAQGAFSNGMLSYREKKFSDASQYFTKAVEAYPGMNDAVYYLNLSRVHVIKLNPNKAARIQAREYLNFACEADPGKAEPHFLLGQFYEMENDKNFLDEAIYHYDQSQKLEPSGPLAEKSRSKVKSLMVKKQKLDRFWGN